MNRYSLGIWTETKALYSAEGPEVFHATMALEDLEENWKGSGSHSPWLHRDPLYAVGMNPRNLSKR